MENKTNFAKEYFEQDNLGTTYPIYFTIRDVDWQASYHFEDGDRFVFVWDSEEFERADTLKELFAKLKARPNELWEFPKYFDFEHPTDWQIEQFMDINGSCGGVFSQKKCWKEKNMFLFADEAAQHLKANSHHYSNEAHVYCKHAWRAPKTEAALNSLKENEALRKRNAELVEALEGVQNMVKNKTYYSEIEGLLTDINYLIESVLKDRG